MSSTFLNLLLAASIIIGIASLLAVRRLRASLQKTKERMNLPIENNINLLIYSDLLT